jgi:hypothetical protein
MIFNLWIIFRVTDFSIIIIFFRMLYSNLESIVIPENLLILIFVIISIILQKLENHELLINTSKKISLLFIVTLLIIIVLVGLTISTGGKAEKFIYFQF